LDGQGGVEVGEDGATVCELLGPQPAVRRIQAGVTPTVLEEQGSGGAGYGLLEETDVVETVGEGTGFCFGDGDVHGEWV